MLIDDLRGYLQLATGLSEVTAAKAKEAAMALVAQGLSLTTRAPDVMGQVQELADDLVTTSRSNREALTALIRTEVDRAVGRMGFVREDELAALRRHVQRLEDQVQRLSTAPAGTATARAASATTAASTDTSTAADVADPAPEATEASAADSTEPVKKKKKKVIVPEGDA